jgi:Mn2+/Fe2+ NRAMP family transporter
MLALQKISNIWRALGPGMLYAGAAVGVSHLVQSTRAGSSYGWSLWWIILLANILKYPFFEFGPRYTSATGKCLLDGYKKLGNYALIIYIAMTLLTMFAIQAAVTIVTAGLMENIIGLGFSASVWSVILLVICGLVLMFDNYQLLNRLVKYIILILTVATVVSLALSQSPVNIIAVETRFVWGNQSDLFFLVALVGWMPAPIDIAVWHSGWSKENNKTAGKRVTFKQQLLDFNIGYIGTALLAICFLGLGARVMYPTGQAFPTDAIGFTKELVNLFTASLGNWSYPIILSAAFCTMLSTTMTLLDAFPRTLRSSFNILLSTNSTRSQYNSWLLVTIAGTSILLMYFISNMKLMVDIATTISFVVAPVLAYLNTRAIHSKNIQCQFAPPKWLSVHSVVGIIFLTAFSLYYLSLKFII